MSRGWLNGIAVDGTRRWGHAHAKPGYSYYQENLIAHEFDGQIRVVGKAWTEETAEDAGGSLLESCVVTP
jgi:hypothetical protein